MTPEHKKPTSEIGDYYKWKKTPKKELFEGLWPKILSSQILAFPKIENPEKKSPLSMGEIILEDQRLSKLENITPKYSGEQSKEEVNNIVEEIKKESKAIMPNPDEEWAFIQAM